MSTDERTRLLHPLEFRILLVLAVGPSFGTRIVEQIEARETGIRLYPANLFRRIRDLTGRGLLEESPAPQGADPRRVYLALTALGRRAAEQEAARLRSLVDEAVGADLLPADAG